MNLLSSLFSPIKIKSLELAQQGGHASDGDKSRESGRYSK